MRALKQTICPRYFPIGRLWVSGWCGRVLHVTLQDRLVWPIWVLQEGDMVPAGSLKNPHLVQGDSY